MFCLDTNILIHAMNRSRPEFAARISDELRAGRTILVPSIVRYELEYGFAKGDRRARNQALLETLLAQGFQQLPFDAEDAAEAGEIRAALEKAGTPIGPYDILIAAQARRRSATLVTLNKHEFRRIKGLSVTDWAR
ncbi:MAG TPA: VapC toxin family PIN domain ribonuclease [Alphaproteobacteria bacterium]|nr:VapC toxin family PIN domain ribonuclease [Alphaproteobacteria bacterium]